MTDNDKGVCEWRYNGRGEFDTCGLRYLAWGWAQPPQTCPYCGRPVRVVEKENP